MKIYCDTNQFPALTFYGTYTKPHGSRGLSKNYYLSFDPKLGHVICAIIRIPYDCVGCTSIMDKPCIYGIPQKKQAR